AFLIFSSVEQMMSKIVMGVLFPAFSEVARERRSTLKRSYYRFHLATSSFTYACAGALMMSGDTIVRILYDQRYAQAGWMLQVLAVAIAAIPFRLAASCLLALGLAKVHSHLLVFRVVSLFVLLPLGFHFFELPGAIWAI